MIRRGSVFGVSVRSGGFLGFCSVGRAVDERWVGR